MTAAADSGSTPVPGTGPYWVYTGRVTNWSMIVASAAALLPVLLLGQASTGDWAGLVYPVLLILVGLALYVLTGSSVRTTAGPQGVTVHLGVLGWPRCRYPVEEILLAEVIDLKGWYVAGGFWWTPRRTCWTVRSGPTVRLVLRSGRTVTISTPDPAAAVAALEQSRAAGPS